MANPAPLYTWDERTQRYRDSRGRFVSSKVVRGVLDEILSTASQDILAVSRQLQAGTISLESWLIAMQQGIKDIHLISGAMALGGWEFVSPSDFSRIGNIIKQEYKYLRAFAEQIANNTQRLDGRFLQRVILYSEKGRYTYTQIERREKEKRGFTQERRVLGQAEHCADCVSYANRGWSEIGTLPAIGESLCRARCKCSFEYRVKDDEQITID